MANGWSSPRRLISFSIFSWTILVFASEYLRAFKEYRLIIFGALLVVFMALGAEGLRGLPGRLAGAARRWAGRAARRPARELGDG